MLAIRLQRLGRKGYPTYRIAVQESRRHPSSGRVVAYVGSYNPHSKEVRLDTEKIEFYLTHGSQPTPRVAKLLNENKVKLPEWVKLAAKKEGAIKNTEKLRKNRPVEEVEVPVEVPAEEVAEVPAPEAAAETAAEEAKE